MLTVLDPLQRMLLILVKYVGLKQSCRGLVKRSEGYAHTFTCNVLFGELQERGYHGKCFLVADAL